MAEQTQTRHGIEYWLGIAAVVLLGVGCFVILLPFLSAILWAAILCITTWPMFLELNSAMGGRRSLAAFIATMVLTLVVLSPLVILALTLAGNVSDLVAATQNFFKQDGATAPPWLKDIPLIGSTLASEWHRLGMSGPERTADLNKLLVSTKDYLIGFGRAIAAGTVQMVFSLLIAFFLYRDGKQVNLQLRAAVDRIGGENGLRLLEVASATTAAVVYGVLGTALFQGIFAAVGLLIAGVPGAAFLGFLVFILSAIVPGGPILVSAPAMLWLYLQGQLGWAIFLGIWAAADSTLDNVVRPLLIYRGDVKAPFILVMLGVLGGVAAFGFIGLFVGPTILGVGYSMFEEWAAPSRAIREST